jgi:hypothetical protein
MAMRTITAGHGTANLIAQQPVTKPVGLSRRALADGGLQIAAEAFGRESNTATHHLSSNE